MATDKSNGYEDLASLYMRDEGPIVGSKIILHWSESLPAGAAVLELGCGPGKRVSLPLQQRGFRVYGIDASPSMVEAYGRNVPQALVECADVLESAFFRRQFDAIVAWGLLFLLRAEEQKALLAKVAERLVPGGRLLFTAPWQEARWNDLLTGRESTSLGRHVYSCLFRESGLALEAEATDEGDNHYYLARKRSDPALMMQSASEAISYIHAVDVCARDL